jgi:hypothetical protein
MGNLLQWVRHMNAAISSWLGSAVEVNFWRHFLLYSKLYMMTMDCSLQLPARLPVLQKCLTSSDLQPHFLWPPAELFFGSSTVTNNCKFSTSWLSLVGWAGPVTHLDINTVFFICSHCKAFRNNFLSIHVTHWAQTLPQVTSSGCNGSRLASGHKLSWCHFWHWQWSYAATVAQPGKSLPLLCVMSNLKDQLF